MVISSSSLIVSWFALLDFLEFFVCACSPLSVGSCFVILDDDDDDDDGVPLFWPDGASCLSSSLLTLCLFWNHSLDGELIFSGNNSNQITINKC